MWAVYRLCYTCEQQAKLLILKILSLAQSHRIAKSVDVKERDKLQWNLRYCKWIKPKIKSHAVRVTSSRLSQIFDLEIICYLSLVTTWMSWNSWLITHKAVARVSVLTVWRLIDPWCGLECKSSSSTWHQCCHGVVTTDGMKVKTWSKFNLKTLHCACAFQNTENKAPNLDV